MHTTLKMQDILHAMEVLAPQKYAESFDNVGLLLGDPQAEVKSLLLCLDATTSALKEAEKVEATAILAHHPLIFQALKSLVEAPGIAHIRREILRKGQNFFAAHTNLDAVLGGVSDALAHHLGYRIDEVFVEFPLDTSTTSTYKTQERFAFSAYEKAKQEYLKTFTYVQTLPPGYGRICRLSPSEAVSAEGLIQGIRERLHIQHYYCNIEYTAKQKPYQNLLFSGGAFDEEWVPLAYKKGIDCLITGECKHHVLLELAEHGIATYVLGHDVSERVILPYWEAYLKLCFPHLAIAVYQGLDHSKAL